MNGKSFSKVKKVIHNASTAPSCPEQQVFPRRNCRTIKYLIYRSGRFYYRMLA